MDHLKQKTNDRYQWDSGNAGWVIRVTVHYMKTQSETRRGVYVGVMPWTIEEGPLGKTESCLMSDMIGADTLVFPMKRLAPRPLADQAARFDPHVEALAGIYKSAGREAVTLAVKAFIEHGIEPKLPEILESQPQGA